jgi:adenosylcobyric acid synthase
VLARDKVLARKEVLHAQSGLPVTGYEIHHGQTRAGEDCVALFQDSSGDLLGAGHRDLPVWGTYLHGIFDSDAFRRWFLDSLRSKKGIDPLGKIVAPYDIDGALDRLAEEFRKAVRIKDLYSLLGLT